MDRHLTHEDTHRLPSSHAPPHGRLHRRIRV